jgi:hypothetical protein
MLQESLQYKSAPFRSGDERIAIHGQHGSHWMLPVFIADVL